MKKILKMLFTSLLTISLLGCSQVDTIFNKKIEIKEMRAIAELATVECYFHNVAKSDQATNKVWYEVWKNDNIRFWIEYEGIVTIGIKADELKVEVNESNVVVYLPDAVVIDTIINDKTLTKDSFYYDPNTDKPTAEQERAAIEAAQEEMRKAAEANSSLLVTAKDNAKELLENYIDSIGDITETEYTIEWIELSDTK